MDILLCINVHNYRRNHITIFQPSTLYHATDKIIGCIHVRNNTKTFLSF